MSNTVEYIYEIVDRYSRNLAKISAQTDRFKAKAHQASQAAKRFGGAMKDMGQSLTARLTLPLTLVGGAMVKLASDAQETQSKFNFLFNEMEESANKQALIFAKSYGVGRTAARDMISTLGDLTQNMGFSQKESFELSLKLNQLAVDVASFKNVSGGAEQVSRAFMSALVGEREALKTLGVAINENMVKMQIMKMLKRGDRFESEEQAKALATVALLQERFSSSMGDFAKTRKQFANQLRIAKARLADVGETLGTMLLPILTKFLRLFNNLLERIDRLSPGMKKIILLVGGLAIVLGPLLIGLGLLTSAFGAIISGGAILAKGLAVIKGALVGVIGAMSFFLGFKVGEIMAEWLLSFQPVMDFLFKVEDKIKSLIGYFKKLHGATVGTFQWLADKAVGTDASEFANVDKFSPRAQGMAFGAEKLEQNRRETMQQQRLNATGEIVVRAERGTSVDHSNISLNGGANLAAGAY